MWPRALLKARKEISQRSGLKNNAKRQKLSGREEDLEESKDEEIERQNAEIESLCVEIELLRAGDNNAERNSLQCEVARLGEVVRIAHFEMMATRKELEKATKSKASLELEFEKAKRREAELQRTVAQLSAEKAQLSAEKVLTKGQKVRKRHITK